MAIETEFKFNISRNQRRSVMAGFRRDTVETFDFETTYFDTADLDLKSRGMQLRLRKDGERVIQTFKSKTPATGPFGRAEHEIAVTDGKINVAHVKDQLPEDMKDAFSSWHLQEQFQTRFRRVSCQVSKGSFSAEECFDTGDIVAAKRSSDISEVEIELKSGPLPEYSSTCLDFLKRVPAGILLEGKAARGFRLAQNTTPCAVVGIKKPLDGMATLPDAILLLLRRHFSHFLDNHPAVVSNGAPPAVHQMRVGIRRLLATLHSFGPVLDVGPARSVLAELRGVFSKLGPIREADVFLSENLPDIGLAGLSNDQASLLQIEITRFRAERHAQLTEMLTSADFARLVVRLNDWVEGCSWLAQNTPLDVLLTQRRVREFGAVRLRELQKNLFKKARKARQGGLDEWHAARIAAKKLRYASTPLIPTLLGPTAAASYEARLSDLQDGLGALNDLNTISALLGDVGNGVQQKRRSQFETATAFCKGWSAGMSRSVITDSDLLLRSFEKFQKDLGEGDGHS